MVAETAPAAEVLWADEIEEHSDFLFGMLEGAADECAQRAAAHRQSLKARFHGQRLRDELAAARQMAQAERHAVLAGLRRNFAVRGVRKRKQVVVRQLG